MSKHKNDELMKAILHGKLPRNLAWTEVVDLISHVGSVEPHGQEFAFTVGSQREFFKKPHGHDLDVTEVALLRNFLRNAAQLAAATEDATGRTVVVIDHHAARIYREDGGSVPVEEATVEPYDPRGFRRHLVHRKEAHYSGERVPEEDSFYTEVVDKLKDAAEIVLIGHGTGTSSAVDALSNFLEEHHSEIAKRIIAVDKVDLSALTDPQIEDLAKKRLTSAS